MTITPANFCACLGPQGSDPWCPCVMEQRGLTPSSAWTAEAEARLDKALAEVFGWTPPATPGAEGA